MLNMERGGKSGSGHSSNDSSSDDESQSKYKQGTPAWTNKQMSSKLLPRPNASNGYWLCALLPLALCTRYLHVSNSDADSSALCQQTSSHKILTIAAIGMCIESFCFFIYMQTKSWIFFKLFISLLPSLLTSVLFKFAFELTWGYGVLCGFTVTFCYQNMYVRVMRGLPKCFTYGEAGVLIEGLALFVLNIILKLANFHFNENGNRNEKENVVKDDFTQLNVIMMSALFLLLITCGLLAAIRFLRKPFNFYILMFLLLLGVTCAPVTSPLPIVALFEFLFQKPSRLIFVLFLFGLVFLTIATVCWQLRHTQKASTRIRKIFHALIILVFVPGLIYECALLYIATGVALAFLTVLELFRILNILPLGEPLKNAFATFSDEKDAGILALTPFSLLIGCSLPIWLHECPCGNDNDEGVTSIALLAGVLSTGIGDAAASVIGSKFGQVKWPNTSRTQEGSMAFALSVSAFSFALTILGFVPMSLLNWIFVLIATIVTAYIEAYTDQIDNLVLPLVFYTIVNLV